ncbi:DUF2326 domain-containing protein [Corynebacterium diphtheriae]|uniref:DUF2326 domain-containing protein n=1 Tax=Corynebacterium diphtheriae TaxID=1717 RepID=UPI0002468C2D|nr:DUF2326 domain-containing protein [Corynebacterium diphtheriae]AEX79925.1 hypothetical protein CDHC03_2200 [Corynebacterium diphtheriae HC03]KJJ59266.1 hypothetical protein NG01_08445 [Corynebacterium diphtheriae]CAB0783359.1 hypothetical protein FRC0184_02211 [Corynebacterium diphtheriae]CAB0784032.1 hypothetical protein FRC0206_00049 [Corynebacterium diphtheriae]CAB0817647.1 hypothetical protein FRC0205_02171 [Corynebacterium diphtheriae]
MLVRLWSDKFMDAGEVRPPIDFHPGLNTVRGGTRAENSIGKSTLLSIIAFAFGIDDFLTSTAIGAVGHHSIFFTFRFEGEDRTYSRATDEPGFVHTYRDNTGERRAERISIDEFRSDLKENYGLRGIDAPFDDIMERFFRIQEHAAGLVTQPLRADLDEPTSAGIAVLEKLFGVYDEIIALEKPYREADKQLRALNAVRDHDLIQTMALKTKTEYNEAKKQLAEAQRHLAGLNGESDQQLLDLQYKRDKEIEGLFQQRHSLRTKAGITRSRIKRIEEQQGGKALVRQAQLDQLQRFFPEVDVRRIDQVEAFHEELAAILDDELQTQKQSFEAELGNLETAIEHIESELRRKNVPVELSADKYKEIGDIAQRVELLQQQVNAWETSEDIRAAKQEAKERLDSQRPAFLNQITEKINTQLAVFDASIYDTRRIPPSLRFDENKRYQYGSPVDDGTGASDKNLILFDLTVLALTRLPAVIHDSPLIKNISDDIVEKILDLYRTFTTKQIFIAFDKDQSYTRRTQKYVEETTVVQLGEEELSLYGFAWNREAAKTPQEIQQEAEDLQELAETLRSEQWPL